MGGKGELVEYTREFREGSPVSDKEKEELKKQINRLIDLATKDITVDVMVKK